MDPELINMSNSDGVTCWPKYDMGWSKWISGMKTIAAATIVKWVR